MAQIKHKKFISYRKELSYERFHNRSPYRDRYFNTNGCIDYIYNNII